MFGKDGRGFGFRRDGKMPENMPGAERFDPDYDGQMPEGRMGFPFGRKKKKDDDKEPVKPPRSSAYLAQQ